MFVTESDQVTGGVWQLMSSTSQNTQKQEKAESVGLNSDGEGSLLIRIQTMDSHVGHHILITVYHIIIQLVVLLVFLD